MSLPVVLSIAAAYFSLIVTAAVLLRDRHSLVHRVFAAGMLLFTAEEVFRALSYRAILPQDVIFWHKRLIAVSAVLPAVWLAFTVTYARINSDKAFSRWKWAIGGVLVGPLVFIAIFRKAIFAGPAYLQSAQWSILLGWPGRILELFFLLMAVLIVFNLERTIRSSTGRMRWQMKFMGLGIGGLFVARIYVASQSLLFSTFDTAVGTTCAVTLIAANALFALSLARGRSLNVDVYLSTVTIQNSLTLILVGIYLISVGVLARFARDLAPSPSIPLDAFVVVVALIVLAVLLLSNRLRHKLRLFVTRHFNRPAYDYRSVWMDLTKRTASLLDANELSGAVSKMVSESLDILSVSVWLLDETEQQLTLAGSTAIHAVHAKELERAGQSAPDLIRYFQDHSDCVDLSEREFAWPAQIMAAGVESFRQSKMRYIVRLHAAGELVGVMTLNDDRIGAEKSLSAEDFVLLETLASHLAASILNVKFSARLRHAKEIETFQTVSTFFVHDLKNLASRLSLTMQNLPANFESPEFRADALRVISTSVTKIDDMCSRLAMLKRNIELKVSEGDLNALVSATLNEFKNVKAEIQPDLRPIPKALVDSEQMHKVLTNLVINASEAVNGNGVIRVATIHEGNMVGFSVRDNGCGMSEEFIENALFKPFQTTKKKGLGIGLFHSKLIVEAHRGRIEVNSALGKGTEFRVVLPRS